MDGRTPESVALEPLEDRARQARRARRACRAEHNRVLDGWMVVIWFLIYLPLFGTLLFMMLD